MSIRLIASDPPLKFPRQRLKIKRLEMIIKKNISGLKRNNENKISVWRKDSKAIMLGYLIKKPNILRLCLDFNGKNDSVFLKDQTPFSVRKFLKLKYSINCIVKTTTVKSFV
ncbi:MAG: hypothetical protein H6625_10985 [Bdellovibrionaceae bacterium]|nr:hypothetical protein [Pseudobdellovibrionaceae bacterium]